MDFTTFCGLIVGVRSSISGFVPGGRRKYVQLPSPPAPLPLAGGECGGGAGEGSVFVLERVILLFNS